MSMQDEAPRNLIGDNQPEGSLLPADALLAKFSDPDIGKYLKLAGDTKTLLAEIGGRVDGVPGVPAQIETDADNNIVAKYMQRLRDTIKIANNAHDSEKAPYLQAGRAVDQFFSGMTDRLDKAREILQARGNAYTARKAAEARAEANRVAQAERDRLAEIARLEQEAAAESRRLQEAADRARKPENIEKLETAAAERRVEAQTLQVDTMIQQQVTEQAITATKASTAAIVRTRFEDGTMATGKQVPYVEITDKTKLDYLAMLPYIKESVLLAAVKAYAKATEHKKPMAGAVIEMRDAADYR